MVDREEINKDLVNSRKENMKEKEIYEQFLRVSGISEDDIVDYRYCTKFYAGIYIPNAITVQLRSGKSIIYEAYDIDTITKELSEAMGTGNSLFMQGYRNALEDVKGYGKPVEHIYVN